MSISYWVAKRFGVLIILFYVVVMGILVVSYYQAGMAEPSTISTYFPPGRSYESSDKYQAVREIYGFPPELEERIRAKGGVDLLSYTDDGAVIRRAGREQETVTVNDVIKYLANQNSGQLESYVSPLHSPLNSLLDLHLKFLRRVEQTAGGDEDGLQRRIVPKIVISAVYLGLVLFVLWILKRVDRASTDYKGGFSLIFGSFVFWPISIIAVSFAGSNVVDVVRHMPESYYFMHSYIVGGWAVLLAWPLFVTVLSIFDIINAAIRVDMNRALAHVGVLAAGWISIPLVTVGVLFAILVVVIYAGYRIAKKVVLPASLQQRRR